jgi:hypothetical protein
MLFNEFTPKAQSHDSSRKHWQLLLLVIAMVFGLSIHPARAHAQIIGELEVNIPFQFYAGDAKLPAGKYVVRMLDNTDLKIMEISSADDSASALFAVGDTEGPAPRKSELIFNKYGNRYFLTKVFDEGNSDGSVVSESQYEKRVSAAAAEAQEHVAASPRHTNH